ncbi:hypothetical protein EIP91_006211 [Steccherinum ochraceum]|uniref:DUF6533 domain-containing protein n=1 Tax=Steccherinum ochraceum TaxID=92696 RepID=A0A4R0RGV8_9APHY|nr:hypothetical protein EIP91_006211 [Steccherinum ochraceum]
MNPTKWQVDLEMNSTISGQPSESAVVSYYTLKHASCYTIVACTFLVLYDTVLTIGQEVELIWRSSLTIPGLIYFISRYSSFLFSFVWLLTKISGSPTPARCQYDTIPIIKLVRLGYQCPSTCQVTIQVWLWAVFNKNRQLLFALGSLFLLFASLQFSASVVALSHLRVVEVSPVCVTIRDTVPHNLSLNETLMRAAAMRMPPFSITTILFSMTFSIFLLALLAYKSWMTYRPKPICAHELAGVLVRDSVTYCLMILALTIYNSLLITIAPSDLIQAGIGFEIALPSIASSRLLLNLRAADKRRERRTNVEGIHVEQWETMFHIT